jgi:hypothetical protein
MKASTASVSSSDSISKTAKISLCPSSMRMSVSPVGWRSLAYTGVRFPRKKELCTHRQGVERECGIQLGRGRRIRSGSTEMEMAGSPPFPVEN